MDNKSNEILIGTIPDGPVDEDKVVDSFEAMPEEVMTEEAANEQVEAYHRACPI